MLLRALAGLFLLLPTVAAPQPGQPPRHSAPAPFLGTGAPVEIQARADQGMQIERDRAPAAELDEHRRLDRALRALLPQRAGTIDAYVVAIALDSDPVFAREARAAGEVLRRRYNAAGRTIVLAGTDGGGPSQLPRGSPATLAVALARIAELMNKEEDALILYTTSHGAPFGLYYNDGDSGYGLISPNRLAAMLDQLGLSNRLLILNACFAGVFVPRLQSETGAIVTAASADRSSFGCIAENDWTFFGDALINHAMRAPRPLAAAFAQAGALIAGWEGQYRVMPSQPQIRIGPRAQSWLDALERRIPPAATQPVGRPAVETSRALLPQPH
ncbi:MAG TPA: C13 family peptidase [Allosphingosinicella sp.]|nr:C13 family peptidase [Allosphingosinicella sp.]